MGVPYAEVIGDPVAHSKSPLIHKFWLNKLGIDGDYRAIRVRADELPDYLAARRIDPLWCGASITIPLKQAAAPLLDGLTYPSEAIGAVNALTRIGAKAPKLIGHNTDAPGFLDTLSGWNGLDRLYRFASVIGTGGGAASVAWALREAGFLIIVYSRSEARGEAFLRRLGESDMDFVQRLEWLTDPSPRTVVPGPDSGDIVVNASPLGMRGYPPLEIDLDNHAPGTIFYDLVYDPLETPLLRAARERGYPVIRGLEMLIAQAARAFYLFFMADAPREHDDELRELLTS
jgi:shikimate dehydrogenase